MLLLPLLSGLLGRAKLYLVGCALIVMLAVGGWSYWSWSRAEMRALKAQVALIQTQADDLAAENKWMQADILRVKQAQDAANRTMLIARDSAAASSAAIRLQNLLGLAAANSRALQTQVNADTATTFKALQDVSNAP